MFKLTAVKGFLAVDGGAKRFERRVVGVRGKDLCLGASPNQFSEINFGFPHATRATKRRACRVPAAKRCLIGGSATVQLPGVSSLRSAHDARSRVLPSRWDRQPLTVMTYYGKINSEYRSRIRHDEVRWCQ